MDKLNERIKLIRTELKLSQRDFSKQISIGQSSVGEIETGTRKVNDRIIQLISSQFKINKNWIITGKGEMFDADKPNLELDHLVDIYNQLDKTLQNYLLEQSEGLLKLHNENIIKKRK